MDSEDVYGRRIHVHFPNQSPRKHRFSPNHRGKSQSPVLHSRSQSPIFQNRSYSQSGNYDYDRPMSPLVGGGGYHHDRRQSPGGSGSRYYMYHRSNSIAAVAHSRSPDYEWNRYHETRRHSYFRTQSLSPRREYSSVGTCTTYHCTVFCVNHVLRTSVQNLLGQFIPLISNQLYLS